MPKEKRKSGVNSDAMIQNLMERGKKEGKISEYELSNLLQDADEWKVEMLQNGTSRWKRKMETILQVWRKN